MKEKEESKPKPYAEPNLESEEEEEDTPSEEINVNPEDLQEDEEEEEEGLPEVNVQRVSEKEYRSRTQRMGHAQITIETRPVVALVDSGSTVSSISLDYLQSFPFQANQMVPIEKAVATIGGENKIIGIIELKLDVNNHSWRFPFTVIDTSMYKVLIGIDFLDVCTEGVFIEAVTHKATFQFSLGEDQEEVQSEGVEEAPLAGSSSETELEGVEVYEGNEGQDIRSDLEERSTSTDEENQDFKSSDEEDQALQEPIEDKESSEPNYWISGQITQNPLQETIRTPDEGEDDLPGILPYSPMDTQESHKVMISRIQELKIDEGVKRALIKAMPKEICALSL